MRRIVTFAMGMIAGGLLLWGALQFHVIRSKQGFHLVAKVNASLANTYVDIRQFTIADWTRHTDVALALTNANQVELIENATDDALRNGIDRWLNQGEER
ncbi:MAG: hypothetical protein AAGD11_20225 [Planctomycetota bacterium]